MAEKMSPLARMYDDIVALQQRISELENKLEELTKENKELRNKVSKELKTMEKIEAKNFVATGGFIPENNYTVIPPFVVSNQITDLDKRQRQVALGMGVNNIGETSESIQAILASCINVDPSEIPTDLSKTDWDKIKLGQFVLDYQPQNSDKHSFIYGFTTPFIVVKQRGFIEKGTSVLTDSSANFPVNGLVNCVINLCDEDDNVLESYLVSSNDATTITINGTWTSDSGLYTYIIFAPLMLGSAHFPFRRLYVGEMIRLGYGATNGSQIIKILWGSGSPEGVVTANKGSLYLRTDENPNNLTLYVKTTGSGNTGWTAK